MTSISLSNVKLELIAQILVTNLLIRTPQPGDLLTHRFQYSCVYLSPGFDVTPMYPLPMIFEPVYIMCYRIQQVV